QLHQWQEDGSEKVDVILQALIACPSQLRFGQKCSPQRLGWLWLLVLQKWLSWDQKTVPAALQRETKFLLLLEELEKDASDEVLTELYEAFECTQNRHESDRKRKN
uniref:Uncharacterized protein n=1 Tax=Sphenodon punctatus TaxID=8508 RepID=A0A8D0HAN8_SPHPU